MNRIKKWILLSSLTTAGTFAYAIIVPPLNEDFSTQPDPQDLEHISNIIPTNTWFVPDKRCEQDRLGEDSVNTYAPGDGTSPITAPNPFPDYALQVGSYDDTIGLNYISTDTWQAGQDYTISFDWVAQPGITNPTVDDYMIFKLFFSGYDGADIYSNPNCLNSWEFEETFIDTANAVPLPTYGQIFHEEITIPASALTSVIGKNTSLTFKRRGKLATIFIDNINIQRAQQTAPAKAIPSLSIWAGLLMLGGLLSMGLISRKTKS